MKYNRIIMLCDYGLDDAIATMHILRNARFDHLDIVPIGGNVSVFTAYENAHTLLAWARADKRNVRIADTRAIEQAAADIPDVHGKDGIGDVLERRLSDVPVISFDELKTDIKNNGIPSRDCLLSLGPCTLPVMLDYVPDTTAIMGGTTKEPPNYGGYEFNEALDLAAFKTLAAKAKGVATLDSCHDPKFAFETFKTGDEITDRLIEKYIALCRARNAPIAVYDYVAALFVTHPDEFDVRLAVRADGVEYNEIKKK